MARLVIFLDCNRYLKLRPDEEGIETNELKHILLLIFYHSETET